MSLIKCMLANMDGVPELDKLVIYLPSVPVKGLGNFDIEHNGEIYNCSVIDVDWAIKNNRLEGCTIYLQSS